MIDNFNEVITVSLHCTVTHSTVQYSTVLAWKSVTDKHINSYINFIQQLTVENGWEKEEGSIRGSCHAQESNTSYQRELVLNNDYNEHLIHT